MSGPAQEHRLVAADFSERVVGASDWDAPSPVPGWAARDVVRHLVEWSQGFLSGGGYAELPPGPSVDLDPVGAWRAHTDAVQALLDDPASGALVDDPHLGSMPLDQLISMIYTADIFMHTWDLARATGQDDRLDPERCEVMLAGMEPIEELIRGSGQYGPRFPVAADADVQARLLGFIGRDPDWRP